MYDEDKALLRVNTPISGPPNTLKEHGAYPVSSSAYPPAYSYHADARSTIGSRPNVPVNHLYIVDRHAKISGAWTVDPTINIPASLMPDIRNKKRMLDNFHLSSWQHNIEAALSLIGAVPTKSHLTVQSRHGDILVDIVS